MHKSTPLIPLSQEVAVTDSIDFNPLTWQVAKQLAKQAEQNARDRPARLFIRAGLGIAISGAIAFGCIVVFTDPGHEAHEAKSLGAIAMILGGIAIAAGVLVRVLQRGRREEIRQALHRELGAIEVERARRDMRIVDALEDLRGWVRRQLTAEQDNAFVDALSEREDRKANVGKVTRLVRYPNDRDRPRS